MKSSVELPFGCERCVAPPGLVFFLNQQPTAYAVGYVVSVLRTSGADHRNDARIGIFHHR